MVLKSEAVLDEKTLEYLATGARQVCYEDGETVVQRGQVGRAFYVVKTGKVEISLLSERGKKLLLTTLASGSSFGEMSLLTGELISADVIAVGPVILLECLDEFFQKAMAESEELRNHVLARLSNSLRRTNATVWDFYQRSQALTSLMYVEGASGPIVAESPVMRRVETRISELGPSSEPVLVSGERGTGKLFVAKKIHSAGHSADIPPIIFDCEKITSHSAHQLIFGSADTHTFLKVVSATATPHLLDRGVIHLADEGTLILTHIDALDLETQETLAGYLAASAEREQIIPNTRIIATTYRDLPALVEKERFSGHLAEQLQRKVLEIPTLYSRRRDVIPLAELFLRECDERAQEQTHHFNRSANKALLSVRYSSNNVAELREAVRLATMVAEGDEISEEHIITGSTDKDTAMEYDLSQIPAVASFISGVFPILCRAASLAFFGGLVLVCLMFSNTSYARMCNAIVWGVWWPSLMLIFLFIGRLWCMFCPISVIGCLARKIYSLDKKPPEWIKKHTDWLIAFLFLVIIWFEQVFHMGEGPLPREFCCCL